jgi:hypothetical protein
MASDHQQERIFWLPPPDRYGARWSEKISILPSIIGDEFLEITEELGYLAADFGCKRTAASVKYDHHRSKSFGVRDGGRDAGVSQQTPEPEDLGFRQRSGPIARCERQISHSAPLLRRSPRLPADVNHLHVEDVLTLSGPLDNGWHRYVKTGNTSPAVRGVARFRK